MSKAEVLLILNSLVYSNGINKENININVYELVQENGLTKPIL